MRFLIFRGLKQRTASHVLTAKRLEFAIWRLTQAQALELEFASAFVISGSLGEQGHERVPFRQALAGRAEVGARNFFVWQSAIGESFADRPGSLPI